MKKFFASIACVAALSVGFTTTAFAQEPAAVDTAAVVDSAAAAVDTAAVAAPAEEAAAPVVAEEGSFHQAFKQKFIEGGADWMTPVAVVLILGLAICLERIIYLNLADVDPKKMLSDIEKALEKGDVAGAKNVAKNTRGPIASIAYQALMRLEDGQGIDEIEKSVVSYGGVQGGLLEKNLSWITLFIALAPSLGFLGTVVGMVFAFDKIEQVGDISPTVVAGGMKVALITTIGGLVVAMVLQVFYNYILSLVEGIVNKMEDASITLLDAIVKYGIKK
ncbi:MAG: MotA/TolQ/ExbB proton channel family protein [Porphyromonas sp.]|nr:MotA/TolQ/ExbB proton channel family protein [Porphyromonas sp.]